jgi:hypothetical protein
MLLAVLNKSKLKNFVQCLQLGFLSVQKIWCYEEFSSFIYSFVIMMTCDQLRDLIYTFGGFFCV